jgi:hypothetical protein
MSTLARAGSVVAGLFSSASFSHLCPSLKCPRMNQNPPSAALSRNPSSASPRLNAHESAALKLSCSRSSRSNHDACRAPPVSSSASSASARKKVACLLRVASASPLSSSRSRAYWRTGSSILYRGTPSALVSTTTSDLPTSLKSRSSTSSLSMPSPAPTASAASRVQPSANTESLQKSLRSNSFRSS